jgi:hypothetical protein
MKRKAILFDKKTILTDIRENIRKTPSHFLGFEIYNKPTRVLRKMIQNKKKIRKRTKQQNNRLANHNWNR